jgi:hypothetical protein
MVFRRSRWRLVSRKGWTRERPTRKPLIVLAGEDTNDRKVLRLFIEALCPNARGRIVEINGTVRFRDADDDALTRRSISLLGKVRARAAREEAEVACLFIQEDFDSPDSQRRDVIQRRVQNALRRELEKTYYLLVAWELEAWLLLFPEAISATRSAWILPNRLRGVDTGRITDPKRVMRHEVSTQANTRYREEDASKVVEQVVKLGLQHNPSGSNRSYDELKQATSDCCGGL